MTIATCAAKSAAFIFLVLSTGAAVAQSDFERNFGALMSAEREALLAIPPASAAALTTALPRTDGEGLAPEETIRYEASFLAQRPAASGNSQWRCLAEALYFEARGESVRGIFGVAEVILNRVESGSYPDTVCGVVNQGTGRKFQCQFSFACDGRAETIAEQVAFARVGKVARLLMDGAESDLTDGATHFHTRNVSPRWARRFPKTAEIGAHIFYRQPVQTASN